jgi:hypothetical protein
MSTFSAPPFRLTCVAALLILSGQTSALPEPKQPENNYNWNNDNLVVNSVYALGVSHWNILRYYDEAKARYGALPPSSQLLDATIGWDTYLASNVPAVSNYVGMVARNNNPPNNSGGWTVITPEIPLANRIVTPVNFNQKLTNNIGFRKPLLPPMRLTRDGRIGLVPGSGGFNGKPQPLRIHLNRPEVLNKHFLESAPGVPTLNPQTWVVADHSKWGLPGSKTTHFASICEGVAKTPAERDPYACGTNGQDDCYNLTLVGSAVKDTFSTSAMYDLEGGYRTLYMPQLESGDRVYSRKMTVRVKNPKTARAEIAAVDFGSEYKQAPIRQGVLYELNTPADGRVLVTRRQGLPLVWRHTTTGQMRVGSYETVYAVAPVGAEPCDASQWGDLRPISHAPYDLNMSSRYGFAKYPFRDPMGNLIPDGEDIKATYPWLDMDAKNISLMISDANLYRDGFVFDKSRFANSCVHSGCTTPSDSKDKSNVGQFTLMGSWTKGKMALMDNKLNYSDFRINLGNAANLELYQSGSALASTTNKSASVEVGGYREVGGGTPKDAYIPLKDEFGNETGHAYLMKNSSLFDSIENRMNYNPHMKPAAPHDVVWLLSSGATSDEFSFDDLLNNHAFILSDMVAAYSWKNENRFRMTGYDGWNELLGGWYGQVKVQNAATTLASTWLVPHSGDVVHGRIEPVGNGGVKGKGMYFNGNNTRILYDIPSNQPQSMSGSYWFHSLFLDARSLSASEERVVLDFPDKSRLTMTDAGSNVSFRAYNNYGEQKQTFLVPANLVKERWFHLGIQKSPTNLMTVFVNGYPYTEFASTSGSMFQMTSGALVLGRAHNNYDKRFSSLLNQLSGQSTATPANYRVFKGWMDEYKVFAYKPDLESICNLAHGTLVAAGTNAEMTQQAGLYSTYMHTKVSTALQLRGQPSYAKYACYMDSPSQDRTAVLHRLPVGSVSIRPSMHFPEGPLYHDAPRPDSTTNEFCLACHSSKNIEGLTVEALRYKNVQAKLDDRRQPTQPLTYITGNIPTEFVTSIKGNWSAVGSQFIDEYLMPSSRGVSPVVKSLVRIQNGLPVTVVNSGTTLTRSGFSSLRANTNGLTNVVWFYVNGKLALDDRTAPFEIPASSLVNGSNDVLMISHANGLQSRANYAITVNP